jgi:hypothetical protein
MDKDQKHRDLLKIVQTIAVAALDIPPDRRTEFIECMVGRMCELYGKKQGRAPIAAQRISMLLELTKDMVRILETSGNTVGHA